MAQASQAAPSHGVMPMAAGLSLENRLIKPRTKVKTPTGRTARSCGGSDAFMRFFGSIPFPCIAFALQTTAPNYPNLFAIYKRQEAGPIRLLFWSLRGALRVADSAGRCNTLKDQKMDRM